MMPAPLVSISIISIIGGPFFYFAPPNTHGSLHSQLWPKAGLGVFKSPEFQLISLRSIEKASGTCVDFRPPSWGTEGPRFEDAGPTMRAPRLVAKLWLLERAQMAVARL